MSMNIQTVQVYLQDLFYTLQWIPASSILLRKRTQVHKTISYCFQQEFVYFQLLDYNNGVLNVYWRLKTNSFYVTNI